MEALQAAFAELARTVEGYIAQHSCSWCGGSFNGGNCHGCSSVGSGNEFVYNPNPYSYNETPNFFNQPPRNQYETYSCELCGDSPHYGFECQTRTSLVYEQDPCSNQNFSNDQSLYYSTSLPQQFHRCEYCGGEPKGSNDYTEVPFDDEQILRQHNIAQVTPPAYTPSLPFLTTMEPTDTLLMGDEDISTTPARETDKFIKSSVDDLVPIPRESKMTSDREQVIDFLMKNEDVVGLPRHLVKQLFSHLVKNPSLTKIMSDEPLGDDSKPRSYDVTFSNSLFEFNDDFTLCNNNLLFDDEFEDISSLDPPKSAPLNYEPLGRKTRVMETPSFGFHHMPSPRPAAYSPTEVMCRFYHPHLTSGDGFDTEFKIFNPFFEIPSDESKVHIEVLSVLWGNRLPILDGSFPLSSCLKGESINNNNPRLIKVCCFLSVRSRCLSLQKGREISLGRNKTTVSGRFAPDVADV
ncbi:hypothetical protein Tco_0505291 [Tanacetum coccineum]